MIWIYKTPGIPDELFITSDNVPGPTKEEIRVITISKARLREGDYLVDVGCGVGSITVEAALQVGRTGKVFAIDEDEEAVRITGWNISKFGVQDTVQLINGKAPEVMQALPPVDAVIVGGSRSITDVLRVSYAKLKAGGRLVVNAITLETAYEVVKTMRELNLANLDVVNVSVARGRFTDAGVMMLARNPITIISAVKP
ncbi:MAG: precorrin-6Y C5,15-methyltransferase (decarboxylating) subunit CbiT [Candidatus Bathyarchaeota archaeon]|nr:precorrin-6Y C5,15-methyltransferase (decarboxylating) subunit CbiT [Candidatus Bathyarchaeota archaeon]MCX8177212.1 precorrin-6Y C5,15-methyltransferase (decarboxylating) subunit CbiT [Candidatus Bathyarchaeota archaeon]MDW8193545.1 precorrin-6Y C5,15-methyltransferase (decarboxylating) subunit CbiT [Nitrososphaerota archaeon]